MDSEYRPVVNDIKINFDKKSNLTFNQPIENDEFTYSIYLDKRGNLRKQGFTLCSFVEISKLAHYTQTIKSAEELVSVNLDFDSAILRESKREKEFLGKLYEWSGYKSLDLIFRGSRDGMTSNAFHERCNNQGPTIILCKNEKGNIFGGYASISWTSPSSGSYKTANGCFLFTLTNIYGNEPTKFPNTNQSKAVWHNPSYTHGLRLE